jgi:hypothetical protein
MAVSSVKHLGAESSKTARLERKNIVFEKDKQTSLDISAYELQVVMATVSSEQFHKPRICRY